LRWVRQRSFVILNPCEVAGIKPSAALVAFEKKFSASSSGGPPTRSPMTVPRGLGSCIGMIVIMCTSQKIRPRFPEARSYTARDVRPAAPAIVFHIVTAVAAIKS
jgi:hypothetical protein